MKNDRVALAGIAIVCFGAVAMWLGMRHPWPLAEFTGIVLTLVGATMTYGMGVKGP